MGLRVWIALYSIKKEGENSFPKKGDYGFFRQISRTHAGSFKTSKIKTPRQEVKMYQGAEVRVLAERKKIKTANYVIFELLHRIEASAKRVGSVSSFIDNNILGQQPERPKACMGSWRKGLNLLSKRLQGGSN